MLQDGLAGWSFKQQKQLAAIQSCWSIYESFWLATIVFLFCVEKGKGKLKDTLQQLQQEQVVLERSVRLNLDPGKGV